MILMSHIKLLVLRVGSICGNSLTKLGLTSMIAVLETIDPNKNIMDHRKLQFHVYHILYNDMFYLCLSRHLEAPSRTRWGAARSSDPVPQLLT